MHHNEQTNDADNERKHPLRRVVLTEVKCRGKSPTTRVGKLPPIAIPSPQGIYYLAYSTIKRQAISAMIRPSQLMVITPLAVPLPPGALLVGGATDPCVGPLTDVGWRVDHASL